MITVQNFYEVAQPHENFWMSRRLTRRLEYPEPGTGLRSTRNQGSVLGTWAIKKCVRPPSHKVYIGAEHQSNPMNACQVAGKKVSVVAVYSVTGEKKYIYIYYYAMALKDMFKNAYKTNAQRRCRVRKRATSPKYWINKLLHVKNFADNEIHACWFQSTARTSREMSVNAARHQGHPSVGTAKAGPHRT
ncbi:hypothetical protein ALC53_00270 [Atta colombica]|uniref:Uncharacterized protein n=1 Tax=Atta colombica TaxID=520822 RepID=A0A195BZJ7_9HYME|nr:hypothetical protein ALC53_00270 [Atta colombica]